MSQPPSILAVCTGNICRSPVIERLLAKGVGHYGVSTSSAGTGAVVGAAIWEPMAALLNQAGGDSTGFAARSLTGEIIAQATLILTATTTHRGTIVDIAPAAMKRTFTLTEFAAALQLMRVEDMSELISEARESTGEGGTGQDTPAASATTILTALKNHALHSRPRLRLPSGVLDLPDPYRQSEALCRSVFASIHQATSTIATVFAHASTL